MRPDEPLDPEVAKLVDVPQGKFVALGSDVAVNREAPVITGDGVMDTQLENLRATLCDHVRMIYNLTTRANKIRMWAMTVTWDGGKQSKQIAPSKVKRDDHPLVQSLIEKAKELDRINAIDCGGDPEIQLKQSANRMRCTDSIDSLLLEIEKRKQATMDKAQDLIKAFHQMALTFKMRSPAPKGGVNLQDLAARALGHKPAS
jgi:hypothetical protein